MNIFLVSGAPLALGQVLIEVIFINPVAVGVEEVLLEFVAHGLD